MNIPSDLLRCSEKYPDNILFAQADKTLTSHQLYQTASYLALRLQAMGLSPQDSVAILLPRGIQATLAIYGVLLMGGCYLPIDIQSPRQRLQFIVQDAAAKCIIGSGDCPDWANETGLPYLDIEHDEDTSNTQFTPVNIPPEQPAALLYTSGSTGTPKGIVISHRAIRAFVKWGQEAFSIQPDDRIASLAPYHFDLSLFDLFTAPLAGATTITLPDNLKLAPGKLVNWLIEQNISSWYTVPSILGFIALKGGLAEKSLPQLRQILFAGEVFPIARLKQLSNLLPHTKLYNLFGPTETNVCLYWPVQPERLLADTPIPAGVPACGAFIKIAPVTQELLVKTDCLMSAYRENGHTSLPLDEQGWFHTGDKVSLNTHNEYQYHGRLDRMIKSAGYRIEPGEIETAFNHAEGVSACAVVGVADPVSGTRIVAVVAGDKLELQSLRKHARQALPGYMQPTMYKLLKKLPMLSNGKIDYRTITQTIQAKTND